MTFPRSDHFNGKTFFMPGGGANRGWRDLLRWKLTGRPEAWAPAPAAPARPPPPAPAGEGVAAAWIGHATFLLRTAAGDFLTDPVFSARTGPWGLGPARAAPPGIAARSLPPLRAVLLSHDHYDHCDLPSLRGLARAGAPEIVTPLGYAGVLSSVRGGPRAELDWWGERTFPGGARAVLTPARHWCRRRPGDTNARLWGGFALEAGGRRVYFAGDTGFDAALFAEIGRRLGPFDLALLPIGAYEPRWFMSAAHMDPAEAVRAHVLLGARRSVGMHWGTFRLTDEGRERPRRDLERARAEAGLAPEAFVALEPGASLLV